MTAADTPGPRHSRRGLFIPLIVVLALLVAGAILQHDHDVVGAILMASAILLAGCAWYANRQRR